MEQNSNKIVSSDNESLILVDKEDNEIGHLSKAECHKNEGVLHRAFSIFLFNDEGHLLIQKEVHKKNCGHYIGRILVVATLVRVKISWMLL